jgi:hypothetical protein
MRHDAICTAGLHELSRDRAGGIALFKECGKIVRGIDVAECGGKALSQKSADRGGVIKRCIPLNHVHRACSLLRAGAITLATVFKFRAVPATQRWRFTTAVVNLLSCNPSSEKATNCASPSTTNSSRSGLCATSDQVASGWSIEIALNKKFAKSLRNPILFLRIEICPRRGLEKPDLRVLGHATSKRIARLCAFLFICAARDRPRFNA